MTINRIAFISPVALAPLLLSAGVVFAATPIDTLSARPSTALRGTCDAHAEFHKYQFLRRNRLYRKWRPRRSGRGTLDANPRLFHRLRRAGRLGWCEHPSNSFGIGASFRSACRYAYNDRGQSECAQLWTDCFRVHRRACAISFRHNHHRVSRPHRQ